MIGQYLPQTNENATVAKSKNFRELNQAIAPLSVWDSASVYLFLIFFTLEIKHQLAEELNLIQTLSNLTTRIE